MEIVIFRQNLLQRIHFLQGRDKEKNKVHMIREIPFTRFIGDLQLKRIALVTTSGVILKGEYQKRRVRRGIHIIPGDCRSEDLTVIRARHNYGDVIGDINCLFPIDRLKELAEEGKIKGGTEEHVSVIGLRFYPNQLKKEIAPQVAEIVEAARAGAALVLAGYFLCHRVAIVLQRSIEERGVPTVLISLYPRATRMRHPPRAFHPVGFKPGHNVGAPHQEGLQKKVIMDALKLLETLEEPGLLVEKEYPEYGS